MIAPELKRLLWDAKSPKTGWCWLNAGTHQPEMSRNSHDGEDTCCVNVHGRRRAKNLQRMTLQRNQQTPRLQPEYVLLLHGRLYASGKREDVMYMQSTII